MQKINLTDKLGLFDTHWDPKVVATYNNNDVMVVKFQGEFPYHKHDDTDDFFLVIEGQVTMDYQDHDPVTFGPGELVIVPKGIVHRPRAEKEAKVLLIEPIGEANSGDSGVPAAAKAHI
ncbi:cupin domain-containing protein [Aestuariibius sp. HNIBRBA575]|uniref:cupin domain-containing protein n=1 Tax=Aestuariibius sp. HNIBRBA575 TaxID=3233343 RepID=UPI0034A22DD0